MNIPYINRDLEGQIEAFCNHDAPHKNVLLVEGARQVGKTSLIKQVLSTRSEYVVAMNLERDRVLRSQIDDCAEFRVFEDLLKDQLDFDGTAGSILFIDEAQESRQLGAFVRFMKEDWPRASVILTGSSLRRLFRGETRYPTGRIKRLILSPFSFVEFLRARDCPHLIDAINRDEPNISTSRHDYLLSMYDEYLNLGGLPAVVCAASSQDEAQAVRMRILADYEEDFRRLFGEETAHVAKACLKCTANHLGNVSKNTSVIPSAAGSQNNRIAEVFERLESWHILLRSDQLSLSPEKSHNYLPKRYLFDTGIARHLREASVPSISAMHTMDTDSRKPLGGILENQVAIDLFNEEGFVQGWKKSPSGTEVDFVLKRGDYTLPVECKAALRIGRRHMKGLVDYLNQYNMRLGFVVSFAPYERFEYTHDKTIINIPAYMAGRLIRFGERADY